jgi:RNA polymerase sigma factor (sigma-70 family)
MPSIVLAALESSQPQYVLQAENSVQSRQPVAVPDATSTYRKLIAILASKAARMGSRDAESAAQEALKRSFENSLSRDALEYYVREVPPSTPDPKWSFFQLLAWLHGVLRRVVLEEHARASSRREVLAVDVDAPDVRDPSPDQLKALIDDQSGAIVRECLSMLSEDYRSVLALRYWEGLKYTEIAERLDVNENTVATRLSRGTQTLARLVLERMHDPGRASAPRVSRVTSVPHG